MLVLLQRYNMKVRKILAMMIACLILVVSYGSMCSPSFAAANKPEDVVSPQYAYTRKVVAQLSIDSYGRALCTGKVGVYDKDSTVALTVKLLKKDGRSWTSIKSWSDSGSGNIDFSLSRNYTVDQGTYMVSVSGKITTSAGKVEYVSKYTGEKTY